MWPFTADGMTGKLSDCAIDSIITFIMEWLSFPMSFVNSQVCCLVLKFIICLYNTQFLLSRFSTHINYIQCLERDNSFTPWFLVIAVKDVLGVWLSRALFYTRQMKGRRLGCRNRRHL